MGDCDPPCTPHTFYRSCWGDECSWGVEVVWHNCTEELGSATRFAFLMYGYLSALMFISVHAYWTLTPKQFSKNKWETYRIVFLVCKSRKKWFLD